MYISYMGPDVARQVRLKATTFIYIGNRKSPNLVCFYWILYPIVAVRFLHKFNAL